MLRRTGGLLSPAMDAHTREKAMESIGYHIAPALLSAYLCATSATASPFSDVNGFEPRFLPPPHAVCANIRDDFGARGDGVTDDTEAFKAAIEADNPRTIYVPAGVYLLSDQLRYGEQADKKKRTLLIGESRATTVLRLAPNSRGFDDPDNPKVFIHTRKSSQQGEQNMHMYIYHLTIEIDSANPGAIALNFHTNNTGALRDVAVRARYPRGHRPLRGIAFDDYWFGPGSGRYLEVDGFGTGIYIGSAQNHTTIEHVLVRNCGVGLRLVNNTASVRCLTTESCDLAVQNGGHMVLVESSLSGGGTAAVDNNGVLLCRDLITTGFTRAIASENGGLAGPAVDHFVSSGPAYNWTPDPGMDRTLELPVAESPELPYPDEPSVWTVIGSSGDVGQAINDAIGAGATDILLTGGTISTTVRLRGSVRRIMGYGVRPITCATDGTPAFRLEEGESSATILELIYQNYGSNSSVMCEQASPRPLVFRHGSGGYSASPSAAGGQVFIESVVGYPFVFAAIDAWLRDINTEQGGPNHVNLLNDGSRVWILGHKTEDWATKVLTRGGGFTELLGGKYRQNWDASDFERAGIDPDNPPPLFEIENAHASLSFSAGGFTDLVRETRDGVTRNFAHADNGGTHALFVGYAEQPQHTSTVSPSGRSPVSVPRARRRSLPSFYTLAGRRVTSVTCGARPLTRRALFIGGHAVSPGVLVTVYR